jgi:cytochrome c-type biogenesis protein CcmH
MRRLALPLAAAALVALAGILAITLARPGHVPSRTEQAASLAGELRCPDCAGLSVAESSSGAAKAIRAEIERLLADGASAEQVRAHFVARYGDWILLSPPTPIAWWLPLLVLLAGVALLAAWLLRGRPSEVVGVLPDAAPAQPEARIEQVRREAESLDA